MIQILRKLLLCVTKVRVIGELISREFLCVLGVHKKYLMEAPQLHKIIPASKPCATDGLCNWDINHFGPRSIATEL